MDEALRQFLEAYAPSPKPAPADGNGATPKESGSPSSPRASSSPAAGAQAAAEGTESEGHEVYGKALAHYLPAESPTPTTPSTPPSGVSPVTTEGTPATTPPAPTPPSPPASPSSAPSTEGEGEAEWLPALSPDELLGDLEDLQFLTNPREVLREVITRVDNHYRQVISQVGLAVQQLAERQLAWELEQMFYRTYPDLVGKEAVLTELVNAFAKDPRWQHLTVQQRMEVLARAARDRLKSAAAEGAPPAGVVRTTTPAPVDEQYKKVQEFVKAISQLR